MKFILSSTTVAFAALVVLGGCTSGPDTAWRKPGISKENYVADLGTCMGLAGLTPVGNGANTAGGVSGRNPQAPAGNSSDYGRQQGGTGVVTGAAPIVGGGGVYRESTPVDVVNRTATQEQTQAMAAQRAASETLKSCYAQRGYQEFKLAPEQRRHLASLDSGSNEYLAYLAEIGTTP